MTRVHGKLVNDESNTTTERTLISYEMRVVNMCLELYFGKKKYAPEHFVKFVRLHSAFPNICVYLVGSLSVKLPTAIPH